MLQMIDDNNLRFFLRRCPMARLISKVTELLTVHELARLLRVPESWIYNHRYYNTLPFPIVRIGRLLRFRRVDIEAYLRRQSESVD